MVNDGQHYWGSSGIPHGRSRLPIASCEREDFYGYGFGGPKKGMIPTHGSGLGTLFVPKVLYGILLRNVSVQIFAKTKKEKTMTSAKSLLPASDTTPILAPSTYDIRNISMKLPSAIFSRLIRHGYRGWIIPYDRTLLHHRSGINLSLRDVHAIVHRESATAIHHHCRRWYIHDCRCRGFILWPMGPAYYHQMAVN